MRFRSWMVLILGLFLWVLPAGAAEKIAVVDFQRALNEVNEGKAATAKLEGMFKEKRAALDRMEQQLKTMADEYQKQAMILSPEAKAQKEQEIGQAQMQYQQIYMQSEGEMQQAYQAEMEKLVEKMRVTCEVIGKEKGYAVVLEATGVVYKGTSIDITDDLITRYNAGG